MSQHKEENSNNNEQVCTTCGAESVRGTTSHGTAKSSESPTPTRVKGKPTSKEVAPTETDEEIDLGCCANDSDCWCS